MRRITAAFSSSPKDIQPITSVEYRLQPRHTQSPTEVVEQMPMQGVLTGARASARVSIKGSVIVRLEFSVRRV